MSAALNYLEREMLREAWEHFTADEDDISLHDDRTKLPLWSAEFHAETQKNMSRMTKATFDPGMIRDEPATARSLVEKGYGSVIDEPNCGDTDLAFVVNDRGKLEGSKISENYEMALVD